MAKVMGYQSPIYHGTKGSTAATQITNAVDVNYGTSVTTGSTKARGDGTSVPIQTGEATGLSVNLTFNMIVDDSDASLTALVAAARTGDPIAIRYKDHSSGTGLNADCILSVEQGSPLEGEATYDFTVEQLSASLRAPTLNS